MALGQPLERLLPREVFVGAVLERHDHVGEAVERDRPHVNHVRRTVHLQLDRESHQPLDFLGGVPRPLRDDFHQRRGEVRVGVHGHALERERPRDDHQHHHHQDQETLAKSELNDMMNHCGLCSSWLSVGANSGIAGTGCRRRRSCRPPAILKQLASLPSWLSPSVIIATRKLVVAGLDVHVRHVLIVAQDGGIRNHQRVRNYRPRGPRR